MKIYLKKSITLILGLVFCASFLYAEGLEKGKKQAAGKVAGSPSYTWLNINNISTWVYNNGNSDITNTGDSGFQYPKGTGKTVFFESGPIWGGSINGYYTIGGSAYRQGLKPGRINPATGTPDNPQNANVRIYRVRPDYKNFTDAASMANLYASEVSLEGLTAEQVYAQYDLDWNQWPAAWGAPFIDKDGNGVYDPTKDIPGVSEDPSQTIWWVANDFDEATTTFLYGGLPMKVEVQATFFAFQTTGPLGNTIFRKYKLISKNTIRFDSMYFCMWSDPDLGGAFDDFAGCDTTLALGFVYNGVANDDIYGATPPASGFDFFQGPRVPTGDMNDSAKFLGKWIKGYKGLGMNSFFYFSQGVEADFSDPQQGNYAGVKQWRNMFEGKKSRTGSPYVDPNTGSTSKFPLSGDPVAKTGWIDGQLHAKNDRRFGQVSGPFTMNPGDTQEVVVGQLAAGAEPGVNYLAAVSVLKFYDRSAQAAYDNDFKVATPPVNPQVKVTEYEKSIILSWSDFNSYNQTESFDKSGFKFQGYNIYQLPSTSATKATAIRVATYDVVDGVGPIVSPDVDQGQVITKVTAYGSDTGVKRFIEITDDKVRQVSVLYPGTRYYFAVTAYAYNPDPNAVPNMLESPITILTATPQSNEAGVRVPTAVNDALPVTRAAGNSEQTEVVAVVKDPKKLTGKTYTVTFTDHAGHWTYNILDGTTVLFANQEIHEVGSTPAVSDPVVGGVQVTVSGPTTPALLGYASRGTNPWREDGSGNWGVAGGAGELWNSTFALGEHWFVLPANVPHGYVREVVIKFATTDNTGAIQANDANGSLGYRYMRAPALSNPFATNTRNYGFQSFGLNGAANVPLAVFDYVSGQRLALGFIENNVANSSVNGIYFPPITGSNNTNREALFILDENYSTTANPNYARNDYDILNNSVLPMVYFVTAMRSKATWSNADEVTVRWKRLISAADRFTFATTAPTTDANLAKEDVQNVNVFPNPYYGINPQEINKYQRFVTFTHLPAKATIKIFNLAGQLLRTIEKDAPGQFLRWDLSTDSGLPVPSGIYVAYIDMPDQGVTKKLKVAIIQEQQILDRF